MRGIIISILVIIAIILAIAFTENPIKQTLNKIIEESEHPDVNEIRDFANMETATYFGKVETNLIAGIGDERGFQGYKNGKTAFVVTKKLIDEKTSYVAIYAGQDLNVNEKEVQNIIGIVEKMEGFHAKPTAIQLISEHELYINEGMGEQKLGTYYKVIFKVRGENFRQNVLSFVNANGSYVHAFSKGHKKLDDF